MGPTFWCKFELSSKIEIWSSNFGANWSFRPKIEIWVPHFGANLSFLWKIEKFWCKLEIAVKNRNLGPKFWAKSVFMTGKNSCSEDSLTQGDECSAECHQFFLQCINTCNGDLSTCRSCSSLLEDCLMSKYYIDAVFRWTHFLYRIIAMKFFSSAKDHFLGPKFNFKAFLRLIFCSKKWSHLKNFPVTPYCVPLNGCPNWLV